MNFEEFKQLYPDPGIANFLLSESISRNRIVVNKIYIDVAQDLIAGLVLNQIIYWSIPNDEGEMKLTIFRDGHLWLAKGREDWWQECRVSKTQFDKACKLLVAKGVVETAIYQWKNKPTKHLRINWEVFLPELKAAQLAYGKNIGYRHRDPVTTSGDNRDRRGGNVLSLQSEEKEDVPIFTNSEKPIPSSLLVKNHFHYQRETIFTNSEEPSIYTIRHSIRLPITHKEGTSLNPGSQTPPPTQEVVCLGFQVKEDLPLANGKEEGSQGDYQSNPPLPEEIDLPSQGKDDPVSNPPLAKKEDRLPTEKVDPENKNSSAPAADCKVLLSSDRDHPTVTLEARMRNANPTPWKVRNPDTHKLEWEPQFLEDYREYLSGTPRYQQALKTQATIQDAKLSLSSLNVTAEGKERIELLYEKFRSSREATKAPVPVSRYIDAPEELILVPIGQRPKIRLAGARK